MYPFEAGHSGIRYLSNAMEESSNCYQRQQERLHEDSQAHTDYSDSATTSHHHLDSKMIYAKGHAADRVSGNVCYSHSNRWNLRPMGDPNKARFPNSNQTRATANDVNRLQMPYVEKPRSLNVTLNSCQQSYFNPNAADSSLLPAVSDLPTFQIDDPFMPAKSYVFQSQPFVGSNLPPGKWASLGNHNNDAGLHFPGRDAADYPA